MDSADAVYGHATVSMDLALAVALQRYELAIDTVMMEMEVYRRLPFGSVGRAELVRWMMLLKQARGDNL